MPCRTRRGGLDVEGLGIVYLEASAIGLPVVAGDSGGAPDAVRPGQTGYVVSGRSPSQLTDRLITLLRDPDLRARLGAPGAPLGRVDVDVGRAGCAVAGSAGARRSHRALGAIGPDVRVEVVMRSSTSGRWSDTSGDASTWNAATAASSDTSR